jgi:hypothetical protein
MDEIQAMLEGFQEVVGTRRREGMYLRQKVIMRMYGLR